MKIKYLKVGKLFIVYRPHSQQIVNTNKNKTKCYEYIFKTVNYA